MRPNPTELKWLNLTYNAFYDIFDEVFEDKFWRRNKYYRYCRIRDAFSIYTELLNYEPFTWTIDYLRKHRPPMEAEIGGEVFKIIRNILAHFPIFKSWDEVCIDRELVNWDKPGQTIDKFFSKYEGHEPVKYRFWRPDIKKMTYVSINFPAEYSKNGEIWLKDMLTEREGVLFSLIFMRRVMDVQVEEIDGKPIHQS